MKAITTLIFVLLIGFAAQAQDAGKDVTETVKTTITDTVKVEAGNTNEVARLYRHKFADVKKELSFATKNTQSKLV